MQREKNNEQKLGSREETGLSCREGFYRNKGCSTECVLWSAVSLADEGFHIQGLNMHPEIINSLAYIKKAAAITNCEIGMLDKKKAKAIVQACDEILEGKLRGDFIVDPIQGGAGTSLNMNAWVKVGHPAAPSRFWEEKRVIIPSLIPMMM